MKHRVVHLSSGKPVEICYRSMRRSLPDGYYFYFPGDILEFYAGDALDGAIAQAELADQHNQWPTMCTPPTTTEVGSEE